MDLDVNIPVAFKKVTFLILSFRERLFSKVQIFKKGLLISMDWRQGEFERTMAETKLLKSEKEKKKLTLSLEASLEF